MSVHDESASTLLHEHLAANYTDLRGIARRLLRHEAKRHTLQPTALVHEAWLRLARQGERQRLARGEFLGAAVGAMRFVLVDHARARGSAKRGGGRERVPIDRSNEPRDERGVDLVAIDEVRDLLAGVDPELAQLVEWRCFTGLDESEIAARLGVSVRTVRRQWRVAKMFLARALGGEAP